jgi:hypothetical protein
MIMPLASSRDKRTQVIWAFGNFITASGRKPGGYVAPGTAVDLENP